FCDLMFCKQLMAESRSFVYLCSQQAGINGVNGVRALLHQSTRYGTLASDTPDHDDLPAAPSSPAYRTNSGRVTYGDDKPQIRPVPPALPAAVWALGPGDADNAINSN